MGASPYSVRMHAKNANIMNVISAIILAAGRSQRYGRDKRLELIEGVPMFLRTALKFKGLVPDTFVVLGPNDSDHERMLKEHGITSKRFQDAALGMGHSLAYAIGQRHLSQGWLVTPADMPFIQTATVQKVLAAIQTHTLVAPTYKGQRGHPVWFEQRYLNALCALSGDKGARSILNDPYLIPVDDPGCVVDIDRPEDLNAVHPLGQCVF